MINFRKKIFRPLLKLIILFAFPMAFYAQTRTSDKKVFDEAESHKLFGEYELAVDLYLKLDYTDNYNIQYKIGSCYLNIPGEKDKAIPFLERAVNESSFKAKVNSFSENRAPLDSYFLLAKSYMIDNQLEKAIITFQTFKNLTIEAGLEEVMKNFEFVDLEIMACRNAISHQETPFRTSKRSLGKNFKRGAVNDNPAVSFDGNAIVYTEKSELKNTILFSRKINGKWQTPVEINSQLISGDDCSSCSLNKDGTVLFLYKTDNFDGNLYYSEFIDNSWTPIRKLNQNINTKYYESHAAISVDEQKLYFTSNREGGFGGLDIYVSEKDNLGDWGPPINLGNTINTIYNEDTPFPTFNDSLLYFSSEGHNGMGGYDIYRSRITGSSWDNPENLGFPLNSTDDDRFFQPFNNDENGYFPMVTGPKKMEIFYFTLTNQRLGRIFEIKGNYSLKDKVVDFDENNSIYLTDKNSGDTLDIGYPEGKTGNYNFIVAPGNFSLVYTAPGYYTQTIDTTVVKENPSPVIELMNIVLDTQPSGKMVYEKLDLSDIPKVSEVDPSTLVRDAQILDVNEVTGSDVLYFTVQVMALYNPVDISYFKYVSDIKVFYNKDDLFYRYTTGQFRNKDEAYAHKANLINMGYPDDLFVKKVTWTSGGSPVPGRKYYTIQIKAVKTPLKIETVFAGLKEVKETWEEDGLYHYLYGRYSSRAEAENALKKARLAGFPDAFLREINIIMEK